MKVLILSTHLMGSGHLVRMAALARGVSAAGGKALLINGGRLIPHLDLSGVDVIQLPPVASDGLNYKTLIDERGAPISAAGMAERKTAILAAFDQFQPDAVITELFPFGRRVLAEEFEAFLSHTRAAQPRPVILASIRDVPEPKRKPGRIEEADARLARFYDAVLVHGEQADGMFEAAWPCSELLRAMLRYTGYTADPLPDAAPDGPGAGEVLVAVGGGAVGRRLLAHAAEAARSSNRRWRLLAGGADAAEIVRELTGDNVIAEPARRDYREMLQRAACSVSLCGYNTALDLIQSGVPSVLVPMEEHGEREQLIRASRLAQRSQFTLLREAETSPEALNAAVETAIAVGPAAPSRVNGAECAARIIAEEVANLRETQE